jgi:dTDP-glucose 4,6-dehydratase
MVAVSDAAEACRLALERPGGGTYNIASPDPPALRTLLGELCRRAGSRSRLLPLPPGPATLALWCLWSVRLSPLSPEQFRIAAVDYVLDTSAARAGLGFAPRHHDADTLFAAYRWYVGSAASRAPWPPT